MVDLKVECSTSGYHSGEVGEVVPETFRIIRTLLDRIYDTEQEGWLMTFSHLCQSGNYLGLGSCSKPKIKPLRKIPIVGRSLSYKLT